MPPSRLRAKLGCWLLLGCWSAGLAEVVSGSSPLVFASSWGLFVTFPLYLFHTVVLVGIVYRLSGRLAFGSLYLAGTLFGLYEAYITKVIWTPTWDPIPVRVGGLHPFETALLVLLWHPLMAFVLPVLVVETTATRSRLTLAGLPDRPRRVLTRYPGYSVAAILVVLATIQGSLSTVPATTLVGNILTVGVLAATLGVWRHRIGAATHPFPELLPDTRELSVLMVLLAGIYVGLGVSLRPTFLPGPPAQATVWLLYLVLGSLLILRLRLDLESPPLAPLPAVRVPGRALVAAGLGFLAVAGVASLVLAPVALAVFVAMYATSVLLGGYLLVRIGQSIVAGRSRA